LPDRFVALGFRQGVEVARAIGHAIVEPLAVTLSPDASAAQQFDISGDGLVVDEAVRWTIDFQRAVDIGMALQMPLAGTDVQNGFDELLVVGVKGSLPPQLSATELARLFDEHHYGRSLAFVRQGTPTNNTERAPSGYPPEDPNGARSLAIERDSTRNIDGRDGERFAAALGIPSATVLHVERSDADEQSGARAMCAALWPATFGYFFEELLFSDDHDEEVDAFRDYFIEHVRARGHYPAFRVGSTPYGVVVASSLTRWASRGRLRMLQSAMPEDLRRLREIWREAAADVARVGKTADPDRDLLDVLEMDASAREVRVRSVMGPNASINLGAFLGLNWDAVRARQFEIASRLAQRLGRAGVTAAAIHGGRSQGQRDRALEAFRAGKVRALVATDVAARGIHVDDVGCVVQYDLPADAKDYLHRAGRTGRAGALGMVVTLAPHASRGTAVKMAAAAGVTAEVSSPSRRRRSA